MSVSEKFAFCLDEDANLYAIKVRDTGTHSTEVHILSAKSGYKEFILHTGTALEEALDNFNFCFDKDKNLYAIKVRGTGTHSTEVHVLSAKSGYKEFILHTGTALEEALDNFAFCLDKDANLYAIKKRSTASRSTEVHVLSAKSGYKQFSLHTRTPLEEALDNFAFCLDKDANLYTIKKWNTGTRSTEVHVLSAKSGYKQFSLHTGTALEESMNIVSKSAWKVLWVICPRITAYSPIRKTTYNTAMTVEEVELVKTKAEWFKDIVRTHTNGLIDVQMTIEVLSNPVTSLTEDANGIYGFDSLPAADEMRLQPSINFDSVICTADYTDIPINWRAITGGYRSFIVFRHDHDWLWSYGGANPDEKTRRYHTNLYIHEWCHQIEHHFPSVDSTWKMPVLHNDEIDAGYTAQNTGIADKETRLAVWYGDYIQGTIYKYPNTTNTARGVHEEWWQYSPVLIRSNRISFVSGATGMPTAFDITIDYDNPVHGTDGGNIHFVVGIDGGSYYVNQYPQQISVDGKRITIHLSDLQSNTRYRIFGDCIAFNDPSIKYKDPSIQQMVFTTK
jgi:hypothetical protein